MVDTKHQHLHSSDAIHHSSPARGRERESRALQELVLTEQRNYSINLAAVIVSEWEIYSLCAYWTLQSCDKLICERESLSQMKNNDADPL